MNAEHTPGADWDFVLPLVYQEASDAYTHIVRDSLGRMVAHMAQDTSGRTERMARCIVRCVNTDHELVRALQLLAEMYDAMGAPRGVARIMADAAIAKATGSAA